MARGATEAIGVGVSVRDAKKHFGAVDVLAGIDLDIEPSSFVALIGPSGCGKTTLLRAIGGVETLTSGSLVLRAATERPLRTSEAGIAFCFQEARLLPWRSVQHNVELPLELAGVNTAERAERAALAIRRMRLSDAADRMPAQLSGGMRMRAAMARALVTNPRLLLLDEPFGALDEVTRYELDEELLTLQKSEGFTAILVTHSLPEAVFLADRVEVFSPRPARLVWSETVELPSRDDGVRTSDAFNRHVRRVSDALHQAIREVMPSLRASTIT